jgi:hypothetical protein
LTFDKELEILINKHSVDNHYETPDFILANYIRGCLEVYYETISERDTWKGR